jgi:hypothetical protein
LTSLPLGKCFRILALFPVFEGATLVVETNVAAGKPPLDRPSQSGSLAPAVGVAAGAQAASTSELPAGTFPGGGNFAFDLTSSAQPAGK